MSLDDKVSWVRKQDVDVHKPSLELIKKKSRAQESIYNFSRSPRPNIRLSGPHVTAKMDAMWAGIHSVHSGVGYLAGMHATHPVDEHAWVLFGALAGYFAAKTVYKTFMK